MTSALFKNYHHDKGDILKPDSHVNNLYSLLLCTLAINILSLALPIMTLQVYDRILPNTGTGTLPVLVSGVCVAIILEAILRLCRSYVIGRSGASYEHHIACKAMNKILNADLSKLHNHGIGEHLHHMGSVGKLKDFYNGHSLTVYAELLFVPLFFGLIFYIGDLIVIIPASILLVFIVTSIWQGYRLRRLLKNREISDDNRFNFLIETLEGIHTLKAFALEKFFERRYESMEEKSTLDNYKVTQETSKTFNMGSIFSHIMVTSVITFGAYFVLKGDLTTGGLIAALLLSGRIMQPVQKALALWTRYQDYSLARHHLTQLFETPQKAITTNSDFNHDVTAGGELKIDNISFHRPHSEKPLLKDINLQMNLGEIVLLSGEHGSGKSTLLDLISGIYPATNGDVIIDGKNVNDYAPEFLINHIGYIRTRALIFRGSIRDNITCFGQVAENEVQEIATLLGVDQDVAKLPNGFDTFLNGNETDLIPPGLKQRIAFTRILSKKPKLILFDNADRSLDKAGYAMIYSLLARLKGKASLLIISDDQNIRSLADRHYVLEDSKLRQCDSEFAKGNVKPYQELKL